MKLVFKIMPPAAFFHGVDYNEKKEAQDVARRVHFQNFGYLQDRTAIAKQEFKEYFAKYSARNERVQKKQFHAMLSCKGNSYSHDQLKEYALQIMQRLGYGDNPLLIYAHHDTHHNHVHIVTSRIAPDGTKIAHDLEGKRANAILTDILQLDPKATLQKDINDVLQYSASSVPQLLLLMERKGYTCKQVGEEVLFYKHGKEQGKTPKVRFESQVRGGSENRIHQIKAVIHKYQGRYNSQLRQTKETFIYSDGRVQYESPLTAYLKEKHGLDFHFFAKGNQPPYGYAIIDHKTKCIYKGSEVMNLAALTHKTESIKTNSEQPPSNTTDQNLKSFKKTEYDLLPPGYTNADALISGKQEGTPSGLEAMVAAFDKFIEAALDGNEMDSHAAGVKAGAKKEPRISKKKFNQRGPGR
jgi:hypothetical protein